MGIAGGHQHKRQLRFISELCKKNSYKWNKKIQHIFLRLYHFDEKSQMSNTITGEEILSFAIVGEKLYNPKKI